MPLAIKYIHIICLSFELQLPRGLIRLYTYRLNTPRPLAAIQPAYGFVAILISSL